MSPTSLSHHRTCSETARLRLFLSPAIPHTAVTCKALCERTANTCTSLLQSVLEGKTDELPARVCDVRDVARAHIRAIEDPSASGRHIISQPNNIPSQDVVGILKERFPHNSKLHGKDGDSSPIIDNSKVNYHNQHAILRWPPQACVSF